jgi:hypothetical protein
MPGHQRGEWDETRLLLWQRWEVPGYAGRRSIPSTNREGHMKTPPRSARSPRGHQPRWKTAALQLDGGKIDETGITLYQAKVIAWAETLRLYLA